MAAGMTGHGTRRVVLAALLLGAVALATVARLAGDAGGTGRAPARAVTLLLVGDLMLGRSVGPVAASDPAGLFLEVRRVVRGADLALANLESPLTTRPHESPTPVELEADPATAALVAVAGFDVLSLANNHAGDAGAASVLETVEAVQRAGMRPVGAGRNATDARRPIYLEVGGVRVAVAAFDATGAGLAAGDQPGVARWDRVAAREVIEQAAAQSDVVIASLHGGVEYLPEADPRVLAIAEQLAAWGADVVWGHGPHVVQPVVTVPGPAGRTAVVATSLGNFLFDQRGRLTGHGAALEVLVDRTGVIARRVGATSHADLRVRFEGWDLPAGDAALVRGEWWDLVRDLPPPRRAGHRQGAPLDGFTWGTVVAADTGRITGDPGLDTVVSFRHRPGPHPVRDGLAGVRWVDREGNSAHLGIYRAGDLAPVWVAGMVPAPVAGLAACDGAVALAYSELDGRSVVATGGAVWRPFGLDAAERLPGAGRPGCVDVDGDGTTDPVILERERGEG